MGNSFWPFNLASGQSGAHASATVAISLENRTTVKGRHFRLTFEMLANGVLEDYGKTDEYEAVKA